MVPASGFIRSHRRESSVDLPHTYGPTIDVKIPGFISNICDPEIELIPIDYSHTMVNIIYEKYQKK